MRQDPHPTSGIRRRIRSLLCFGGIFLVYTAFITVTGIGCPIRWMTGIPCPGCGMSRAFLCLLLGDWPRAFRYHPAVFLIVPVVLLLFLAPERTARQKAAKKLLLAVTTAVMVLLYVWRILHHDPLLTLSSPALLRPFLHIA